MQPKKFTKLARHRSNARSVDRLQADAAWRIRRGLARSDQLCEFSRAQRERNFPSSVGPPVLRTRREVTDQKNHATENFRTGRTRRGPSSVRPSSVGFPWRMADQAWPATARPTEPGKSRAQCSRKIHKVWSERPGRGEFAAANASQKFTKLRRHRSGARSADRLQADAAWRIRLARPAATNFVNFSARSARAIFRAPSARRPQGRGERPPGKKSRG